MASYRFTLRTPDTSVIFGAENVRNWADIKPSITSNDTYRGMFKKFTNTFEFDGNIRRLIIEAVDIHGYDVELFLSIEIGDDNKANHSFVYLVDEMKAEIESFDVEELAVLLNFVDSGFKSDLMSREAVKIDWNSTKSIDGANISAPRYFDTRLHDRTLIFNSLGKTESDTTSFNRVGMLFSSMSYVFPISFKTKDHPKLQSTAAVDDFPILNKEFPSAFYKRSEKARRLYIKFSVNFKYRCDVGNYRWRVHILKRNIFSTSLDGIIYLSKSDGNTTPAVPSFPNMDQTTRLATAEFEGFIDVEEDDELILRFTADNTTSSFAQEYTMTTENLRIEVRSNEYFEETISKCTLPYEYFTRQIEILTGQPNAFYSEFFGRRELGYEVDGPGAHWTIQNGKMIRNFPFTETDLEGNTVVRNEFTTSFRDMFIDLSIIRNLAGRFETRNGLPVFRIEKYIDIYPNEVVFKINKFNGISRRIDEKSIYSEINVGYKDQEYEELNGQFTYNGEANFITPLRIKAEKLDLISGIRTDDLGIEITRRLQYNLNPSLDYRADKDLFLIDCRLDRVFSGEDLVYELAVPIRDTNFEVIQGIYEPDKAYNLNLAPGRVLRNWGVDIKSCLLSKVNGFLKYAKGANNPNLATKKVGEETITENADLLISTLDNPLELPEIITITETPMTLQESILLDEKIGGLIELEDKGVTIYGRVVLKEFDINKGIVNFELKRANY